MEKIAIGIRLTTAEGDALDEVCEANKRTRARQIAHWATEAQQELRLRMARADREIHAAKAAKLLEE